MQQQESGRQSSPAGSAACPFLLSVIIKNYNYARFLPDAIRSALEQTYENVEVIVVDDGSSDGSREIIEAFGNRVRAIFQPNQGETTVINCGFAASHGDAVIFLDADDKLWPSVAEEIAAVWRSELAKVQYGLEIIDAAGESVGVVEPLYPRAYSQEKLRRDFVATNTYSWPPSSGNAFSRSLLLQLLPLSTRQFSFAADGVLSTVAPLYGEVHTLAKPLGCYRIHGSNMWALDRFVPSRFDQYLAQRHKEIEFLRARAAERGIALSANDPLDHSLPFLCYRLAQAKLKPDRTPGTPGPFGLCLRAVRYLRSLELSRRRLALELAWFIAVGASPRVLARRLIELRFAPSSRPALFSRFLRLVRARPRGWSDPQARSDSDHAAAC